MGIDNAGVVWGDGLAVPGAIGRFDRIFVEGRIDGPSNLFDDLLTDDGILLFARSDPQAPARQRMLTRQICDDAWTEAVVSSCRMQPILPGLARAL
jgi:protein-L-isoaspartate(D-aspartate) O-methyltransferase